MGSCSSSERGKVRKDSSVVESHVNQKHLNGDNAVRVWNSNYSLKNSDSGSKTEVFFNSRACIDSDGEDDFFSVNGDFASSRGTTPNRNPSIDFLKSRSENSLPFSIAEFSPTGEKSLNDLPQGTPEQNASIKKSETNMTNQEISKQTTSNQSHGATNSKPSTVLKSDVGKKTIGCC